jgi:hypothetical protein
MDASLAKRFCAGNGTSAAHARSLYRQLSGGPLSVASAGSRDIALR